MADHEAAIPTIRLEDGDTEESIQLLRSACREVGFFYLESHGIDSKLIEDVFAQAKLLFQLSDSSKQALSDPVLSRGYTALREETLDPSRQLHQGDTKEGFYFGPHVPEGAAGYDPQKLKGPNVMPSPDRTPEMRDCVLFQATLQRYFDEMSQLGFRVVQLIALSLGLEKTHFDKHFQNPMAALRLLHYEAVQSNPEQGLFAAGAHSDYGMITLLATDGTPGLQVQTKAGQWIDVPHKPNAFVVNLGDMLERWSNGLYRSTPHRVVTSGSSDRYSMPFFYEPDFDTKVECLAVCCSEKHPPQYPPTTSGQHLLDKYRQTHADFRPKNS